MANKSLAGMHVAILVADGFEQIELTEPRRALEEAGAKTTIVSPAKGSVQGWNDDAMGDTFPVDVTLELARPYEFDALLLPGGVQNPDRLRMLPKAVQFLKHFLAEDKPVAALNEGADLAAQLGAQGNELISYRRPGALPAFSPQMVEAFAEARAGVPAA